MLLEGIHYERQTLREGSRTLLLDMGQPVRALSGVRPDGVTVLFAVPDSLRVSPDLRNVTLFGSSTHTMYVKLG